MHDPWCSFVVVLPSMPVGTPNHLAQKPPAFLKHGLETLSYMAFVGGSGIKVGKKVAWRWSPGGLRCQKLSNEQSNRFHKQHPHIFVFRAAESVTCVTLGNGAVGNEGQSFILAWTRLRYAIFRWFPVRIPHVLTWSTMRLLLEGAPVQVTPLCFLPRRHLMSRIGRATCLGRASQVIEGYLSVIVLAVGSGDVYSLDLIRFILSILCFLGYFPASFSCFSVRQDADAHQDQSRNLLI